MNAQEKIRVYKTTLAQVKELISAEDNAIANLANISSLLRTNFNFFWVGFYIVKNNELVLGPFQGSVACTRISPGKGVCGTVLNTGKTLIVDDVHAIKNHISCNPDSVSEIVVPVLYNKTVIMVLDIDSNEKKSFTSVDAKYLGELTEMLANFKM